MVSDSGTLHLPNLHLHDVLKEASSDQVIKLSFIAAMLSLILANLIVQVVDVVRKIVPHDTSRSCLKLKHDFIAVGIDTPGIDLRPEEDFT
jgi:hypothetical protein